MIRYVLENKVSNTSMPKQIDYTLTTEEVIDIQGRLYKANSEYIELPETTLENNPKAYRITLYGRKSDKIKCTYC